MWLISCNVLPVNHRVTSATAQVFDLAQTLRDGVLLCQLLNNLRAHTINLNEINLRPQMSQVHLPSYSPSPSLIFHFFSQVLMCVKKYCEMREIV